MSSYLVLDTAHGRIKARLCESDAPQTCKAIKQLVAAGCYERCVFYRAEPEFVVQGGLRRIDGQKVASPVSSIPLEVARPNVRGALTMARWEDPSSGTGEFFIVLDDAPHLDKTGDSGWALGFCCFGEVVEGMDVADAISELETTVKGGLKMLNEPVEFKASIEKESVDRQSSVWHAASAARILRFQNSL